VKYPGRFIKEGEKDARIVKALKQRLNKVLVLKGTPDELDPTNRNFGPKMKQLIKLFQDRNVDSAGVPLKSDGQVGSLTWAALFGDDTVPGSTTSKSELLMLALTIAGSADEARVREDPPESNTGPEVSRYLERAGCPPGNSWCCAFVYYCMDEAAKELGRSNPMVKTVSCMGHWNRAAAKGAKLIHWKDAIDNPGLIHAGMIFVKSSGGGLGHTGFVERVVGGTLHTIEGNTNGSGSREGGGVYRLRRNVSYVNKGFIDYAAL
jgi:hypothetical protein